MREIIEKIFFFENADGKKLLGFIHNPVTNRQDIGLIYVHPFAEEKNCSHVIAVKAARALASQGFAVLRFDLSGCGDSEAELEDVTVQTWQQDLKCAIRKLKEETKVDKIALWGLRLGASLVLLNAPLQERIAFIILWQPVFDLADYIHKFLRNRIGSEINAGDARRISIKSLLTALQTQKKLEVLGYTISESLYDSFVSIGKSPALIEVTCPLLVLSISKMPNTSNAIMRYVSSLKEKSNHLTVSHLQIEPFWDRYDQWNAHDLIDYTTNWLKSKKELV